MQKSIRNDNRKKINASFVATLMLLSTMTTMAVFFATPAVAEAVTANVWTTDIDGNIVTDFAPGELVYIHGEGFTADAVINMSMTRPDGAVEYADSNPRFIDGEPTANATGCFELLPYDLDGIVNYTRYIEGVELGILFYVESDDEVKVGFRSKQLDVSYLAGKLNGGGHIRAAGCRLQGSYEIIKARVFNEAFKMIADLKN